MNSDFKELLSLFNDNQVKYLVVGGVAFIFHAEPRYTKDIDLWVKADQENAARVYKALAGFGAPIAELSPDDFAQEGYFFQMGVPPVRVDILMSIPGLVFDAAWEKRVETQVEEVKVLFVSKEDLIVSKRAAGRPQDLQDIISLSLPAGSPRTRRRKNRSPQEPTS